MAQKSYDAVMGVIRMLDETLVQFQDQLRREGKWPADAIVPVKNRQSLQSGPSGGPTAPVSQSLAVTPKNNSRRANVLIHPPQGVRTGNTTVVEDLPIDPNEFVAMHPHFSTSLST